jgi:Zn-dependent metalloprotease
MRSLTLKRMQVALSGLLLTVGLLLGLLPRGGPATPSLTLSSLQERTGDPLTVAWQPTTGIPSFLAASQPTGRLAYRPTAAEAGKPVAIARGFLDENRALFRLKSVDEELRLLRLEPDHQLGYAHVRLAQVHHGLPVFARQLVVHLDPQHRIVAVNGGFAPALNLDLTPTIAAEQAEQLALEDLLDGQFDPYERARVTATILKNRSHQTIYVDDGGKATLTWAVTIMTNAPLGQWRYFVNARRLVVVHRIDSLEHGKYRRTFSAQNTTDIPGRLLIEEGERSRDAVAQAAHDAAGKVYDYYATIHKRDGIDGRGSPMVSTVHFGSDPADAENAAWVGEMQQMIYGDGGRLFRPLPYGLDVVGHEFTHGVIESTAGLVYQGQSGALNESYADIFGALIDAGNWTLGEQVVKSPPYPAPYLRSLEDPNLRGNYDPRNPLRGVGQPSHMREFANLPLSRRADNGGVHINSGIPNRAAFLVAQALGPQKMEQIYYRALTQYLTPDARFLDAGRATVRAAADLYGATEAEAVRAAFAEVGLDVGGGDTAPTPPSSTPQRGPAVPPPAQTLPAGCVNLVNNGGFESEIGWTQVSTNRSAIIDAELPYTGARSAWLGGTDKEPLQYIYQDVTIPANATSVQLEFYRNVHQEMKGLFGLFASDARFNVLVATPQGEVLGAVERLTSSQHGDDTWRQSRFDLSQLAGKSFRLVFASENPPNNVSGMFVDDVALVACSTGSGPAAPSTTSQELVFIQGTIVSGDTNRGVSGAQVFILKPGITASQAAADDAVTASEVLTLGTTDDNGFYQTQQPIARGQGYSVIIIARGYRPVLADGGMQLPADASNPTTVNATLRRSR